MLKKIKKKTSAAATSWKLCAVAIAGIVILEAYALYLGHNGMLFSLAVGAIAGLAGFKIRGLFR